MKMKKPKKKLQSKVNVIYEEKYNVAIANMYYKHIRKLIKKYYTSISDSAINEFLRTGDLAELTAVEFLARSGFTEMQMNNDIKQVASNFVFSIQRQTKSEIKKKIIESKQPAPPIINTIIEDKTTKNLISQQVQKITNLLDYQYVKINETLQNAIVENRSLSEFKQQLRQMDIGSEKRIKVIAYNQLHYATNVTNINSAIDLGIEYGEWVHPPKSIYKTEPRPSHVDANGKYFKLSEGCKIDGEYIYPGQLPNCRCTFTYKL